MYIVYASVAAAAGGSLNEIYRARSIKVSPRPYLGVSGVAGLSRGARYDLVLQLLPARTFDGRFCMAAPRVIVAGMFWAISELSKMTFDTNKRERGSREFPRVQLRAFTSRRLEGSSRVASRSSSSSDIFNNSWNLSGLVIDSFFCIWDSRDLILSYFCWFVSSQLLGWDGKM